MRTPQGPSARAQSAAVCASSPPTMMAESARSSRHLPALTNHTHAHQQAAHFALIRHAEPADQLAITDELRTATDRVSQALGIVDEAFEQLEQVHERIFYSKGRAIPLGAGPDSS
jgi:hypothetical protein